MLSVVSSRSVTQPGVLTLRDTAAARVLRAALMEMAARVARDSSHRGTLRLVHPRMSEARLEEEWEAAAGALRPSVVSRLSLQVAFRDGRSRVFGKGPKGSPDEGAGVPQASEGTLRLPPRDASFAVEKVLVWAWLTRRGPLTRAWVEATAGCSYPTVAGVVRRLGSAVRRHPDRRVELTHVPREQRARLFALSGEARATMRFGSRSGQPEAPAGLLRRLVRLAPDAVAVGGVAGALHHHPQLDVVGLPRLDLSIHAPGREADLAFVARLDPALKRVEDPAEPAQLVLHFVRHAEALFETAERGLPWADAVECLLDLNEAGLQAQALELLDALSPPGAGAP